MTLPYKIGPQGMPTFGRARGRQTLVSGPWRGVRNTTDPFDDSPDLLVDAENLYIADPSSGSGAYARAGFPLTNGSGQLGTSPYGGNGIWCYVSQAGTIYNFFACGGKLYRSTDLVTYTDVTPTGVTISSDPTARVHMLTFNDQLIVSDGVYPPWVGSNLGATPITATQIHWQPSEPATLTLQGASSPAANLGYTAFSYLIGTQAYVLPVNTSPGVAFTGTVAWTNPNDTYGAWLVTVNAAGVVTVTPAASSMSYTSEALALAALPAAPANTFTLGTFTVHVSKSNGGSSFIGGTTALATSVGNWTVTFYPTTAIQPYSAYGRPWLYAGALFFFVNQQYGVYSRELMMWSEPLQPTVGYQQTNYADWWNLVQASPNAVYAGAGTDYAITYWRDTSIGRIVGAPGASFQSTATKDAISANVGSIAPESVQLFAETFFFTDRQGRPWMLPPGQAPVAIWQQMRAEWVANAAGASSPATMQYMTCSALHPELNEYLVACWSPSPGTSQTPTVIYSFDAASGTYQGKWTVGAGIAVSAMGIVRDTSGTPRLAIMGTNTAGGTGGGYVWVQQPLSAGVWTDNGAVPTIYAQTGRLGYAEDTTWTADRATVIAMSNAAVSLTVETPYTAATIEATAATPSPSQDGTYRIPVGLDVRAARGMQFTVSPTTATTQWGLQRVSAEAVPARARPEDA